MTSQNLSNIRLLNAHGPYEHGIWSSNNSTKESLRSKAATLLFFARSFDLVERISNELLSLYKIEDLTKMSILDVGCYDGWILHQLDLKFNFKRAVGVEPREKNIHKGKFARNYYEIESAIEILQGSIDSADILLNGEVFDIVLCLGTLHHVESAPNSVAKLAKLSRDLLIIDSMVIEEPRRDSRRILQLLNLKDIVYAGGEHDWAVAAFKFESPYLDGSTAEANIVNVPEERLIRMALKMSSFKVISASSPEKAFYNKKFQKLRGVKESFLVARHSNTQENSHKTWWTDKAQKHEEINVFELLDIRVLEKWTKKLGIVKEFELISNLEKSGKLQAKILFAFSLNPLNTLLKMVTTTLKITMAQREILFNISRSPLDKSRLEVGKTLMQKKEFELALVEFALILDRDGADWRSFYRAAYLSMIAATNIGDLEAAGHFYELLKIANPDWPVSNQIGMEWVGH